MPIRLVRLAMSIRLVRLVELVIRFDGLPWQVAWGFWPQIYHIVVVRHAEFYKFPANCDFLKYFESTSLEYIRDVFHGSCFPDSVVVADAQWILVLADAKLTEPAGAVNHRTIIHLAKTKRVHGTRMLWCHIEKQQQTMKCGNCLVPPNWNTQTNKITSIITWMNHNSNMMISVRQPTSK